MYFFCYSGAKGKNEMLQLYFWIEDIWFKLPEKIRFLLVGGFNTVVAYTLFSFLYYILNGFYTLAVIIQYILTIQLSFITMRYYVFRGKGPILKEYIKAISVYIWLLFFNMAWLFVFIDCLDLNGYISQAFYIITSTILTYLFHKNFSFKTNKEVL